MTWGPVQISYYPEDSDEGESNMESSDTEDSDEEEDSLSNFVSPKASLHRHGTPRPRRPSARDSQSISLPGPSRRWVGRARHPGGRWREGKGQDFGEGEIIMGVGYCLNQREPN
jgi:hypothetical protein